MNKRLLILILIFHTALGFNCANAQYSKLLDFNLNYNGQEPDGTLVSDGTYFYGMTQNGGKYDKGVVFKIKISDNTYTKLFEFSYSSNGQNPYSSLTIVGNFLYGVASGGSSGCGVLFKINKLDNSYTKVIDFDASKGWTPSGALISSGTYLYGMTRGGGTHNNGVIFRLNISDNTYNKIVEFDGTNNGGNPEGSLILHNGFLYGTTKFGGSLYGGVAFKVSTNGSGFTKIFNLNGNVGSSTGGYFFAGSLVTDGTYMYGMTELGGINDMGVVFKINISNNTYTKMLDFNNSNGFRPIGSLILDGSYLYGMTQQGGSNNMGVAFKINKSNN